MSHIKSKIRNILLLSVMIAIVNMPSLAFATEVGETPEDELSHSLTHYTAQPATSTKNGNIEYWYCNDCGQYFSDSAGTKVISKASTVIPKLSKKANTLSVKVAARTYKRSSLKKAKSFNIGASGKGNITYARNAKAKKAKIKVSSKGKVTVPKKCKKGTYKITVRAAGNDKYDADKKTVTIKVV